MLETNFGFVSGDPSSPSTDGNRELRLLIACGRSAHRAQDAEELAAWVDDRIDWGALLLLARRHKSSPLLWKCLHASPSVPPQIRRQMQEEQSASAMRCLRMAGFLAEAAEAFSREGIRMVSLKGPALAMQILGDVTLRQSADLDLYVQPGDVARADRLLRRLGFEPNIPRFDRPLHRRYFMSLLHEMQYLDMNRAAMIELHWRPVPNPFLLDLEPQWPANTEEVRVGRVSLLVPAAAEQITYLCLHGAKHDWFALRWLFDLVPLLERVDPRQLRAYAERIRAWPFVLQGLLLADELLGMAMPQTWNEEARDARIARRLERSRLAIAGAPLPHDRWFLWRFGSGFRFQAHNAYSQILNVPADWQQFPLPGALLPLYLPLRPLFRMLRARRRRAGDPESRKLHEVFPDHTHTWS